MTLPYSPSIITYIGNGLTIEFPFDFKVWNSSHLRVIINPLESTSFEANFSAILGDGGGIVTYFYENKPLPSGWKLSIMRNMPLEQLVDLITGTRFDPQVIESSLDYIYAVLQQLGEGFSRALQLEPGTNANTSIDIEKMLQAVDNALDSAKLSNAWAQSDVSPDVNNANAKSAKSWAQYVEEQVYSLDSKIVQMLDLHVAFIPSTEEQGAVIYDVAAGLLSFIVPYGPRGEQGTQGMQGIQGDKGDQGIQGAGEKGEHGIQGIKGERGSQGERGTQGIKGAQGESGIQGEQGGRGTQGFQGTQGIKGEQGEKGIQGIQGIQGINGLQGGQGLQGIEGERGLQGIAAPQGIRGEKGEIGDSPWASAFGYFRLHGADLLLDYVGENDYNTFSINDNGELEVVLNGNT